MRQRNSSASNHRKLVFFRARRNRPITRGDIAAAAPQTPCKQIVIDILISVTFALIVPAGRL
jgi:hypothetical protein